MRLTASIVVSLFVLLVVPGVSFAGTPQQVTYHAGTILHRGAFIHGSDMSVMITEHTSSRNPSRISTDCQGSFNETGRWPDYAVEYYGKKNIGTTTCQNPLGPPRLLPMPGHATRTYYHRLRRRALRYACHSLRATGRRHQKGHNRAHVPCRHLLTLDSTKARSVLIYRTSHGKDVHSVVLASDGRMIITYRNGFTRTYPGRVMV